MSLIHFVSDYLTSGIVEGEKSSSSLLLWSYGSHIIYVCYGFGVRRIGSIQEFNVDDFGSRTLLIRNTCKKTYGLS
jgi:hypothetical protein